MLELALGLKTREPAGTPAQVRSRRRGSATAPPPSRPEGMRPEMGLTRPTASTTHPAQPRELERFREPLAALTAATNSLPLPETLQTTLPASA